ncbi:MAG: SH3 domain-containing protein [Chloroflexi bacterium]|nr:SH3 domain-containing protein [Chloroflexota bacterium]
MQKLQRYALVGVSALLMLSLLLSAAAPAAAGSARGLSVVADCTGLTVLGGTLRPDRDNTGRDREAFIFTVTDGSSQIIFEETFLFPVGQNATYSEGARFPYVFRPRFNPLVVEITSAAGNGLREQLVFLDVDQCVNLPLFGSGVVAIGDDLTFVADLARQIITVPADGRPGPSVPLNETAPRPVNPAGLAEVFEGYAIVDTDNLNLRSGDGPQFTVVGVLDGGTRLVVLGSNGEEDPDDLWWFVEVGGVRGWVKSEFLILRGSLANVPEVPVRGEINQPSLYIGVRNPIYNIASLGSRVICEVPGDLFYPVTARDSEEASWFQIEAVCNNRLVRGWIPAELGLLRNNGGVFIPIFGN